MTGCNFKFYCHSHRWPQAILHRLTPHGEIYSTDFIFGENVCGFRLVSDDVPSYLIGAFLLYMQSCRFCATELFGTLVMGGAVYSTLIVPGCFVFGY